MIFFFHVSGLLTLPKCKLKAFADNKKDMAEKSKFVMRRVENIVGNGENAGYQHFLLFPQYFQKASTAGPLKSGSSGKKSEKTGFLDED